MTPRAALALGLTGAGLLACTEDTSDSSVNGAGASVLGVVQYTMQPSAVSGSPPICAESGRVLAVPVLIDTTLWAEFDLPILVGNGEPAQAEGPQRFDQAITPTGLARAAWECLGAPFDPRATQSRTPVPNLDGGWVEWDSGAEDLLNRADASYLPPSQSHEQPLPELVLRRRDPETPFCRSGHRDLRDDDIPIEQRATSKGETILGGDDGLVVLRAVSRDLVQDMDLELQLGEFAGRCCAETGSARCEGPLFGPACERIELELRTLTTATTAEDRPAPEESLEPLIRTLAARPPILWLELRLSVDFMNPYGTQLDATGRIRVGFCRGCGGRWPPGSGSTPSPLMECIARKPWEAR